jgi:hypothetical protein
MVPFPHSHIGFSLTALMAIGIHESQKGLLSAAACQQVAHRTDDPPRGVSVGLGEQPRASRYTFRTTDSIRFRPTAKS